MKKAQSSAISSMPNIIGTIENQHIFSTYRNNGFAQYYPGLDEAKEDQTVARETGITVAQERKGGRRRKREREGRRRMAEAPRALALALTVLRHHLETSIQDLN